LSLDVMTLAHCRLPIGSNKTTGLMGHTTQRYRLLVAFGTLVVAYSLIFFSYIVCMHILIDGYWNTPSHLIVAFLPPPFASFFSRLTLSIPTTSHILFSATYNQLGSFTLLPPMFGIHGFTHIYATLVCQPIYFSLKKKYKV